MKLINLPTFTDERGSLTVGSLGSELPFEAKRFFFLHECTAKSDRGGHAHFRQEQLIVSVTGVCVVGDARPGSKVWHFTKLDSPRWALYLPPWTWVKVELEHGAVALVLSSGLYDEAEYIRDWKTFQALAA